MIGNNMKKSMKTNKLEETLYQMFTQNTGIHYMDSGGTDGRRWQRNQGKTIDDFNSEPFITYVLHSGGIYSYINTWQAFREHFYIDSVCEKFNKKKFQNGWSEFDYHFNGREYVGTPNEEYKSYEKIIDKIVGDNEEVEVCPVYLTYNEPNEMDYDFKYQIISDMDKINYVIISMASGCDIRGGYGDLFMFAYKDYGWGVPYLPFEMTRESCQIEDDLKYNYECYQWIVEGSDLDTFTYHCTEEDAKVLSHIYKSSHRMDFKILYDLFIDYKNNPDTLEEKVLQIAMNNNPNQLKLV